MFRIIDPSLKKYVGTGLRFVDATKMQRRMQSGGTERTVFCS